MFFLWVQSAHSGNGVGTALTVLRSSGTGVDGSFI